MNCPIEKDALRVRSGQNELVDALRKLRRDLLVCRRCPRAHNCGLRLSFRTMVDTAVREINEEWSRSFDR
jgi:hypothetical protein